ncbi:MAG: DNA polymerase I [candidate division WS1 bacterium]|nr:DNA polymerase I [candidate division WS1 bacterium]
MEKPRLLLVDGNSLLHRAFHALPPLMTSDGRPTNAIYGLAQMLVSLLEQHPPQAALVAFDAPGPTLRHQEFAEYKATRKPAPEDLAPQFSMARELVSALGLAQAELSGWEADDLISSVAQQAEGEGYEVIIVTGDRDLVQLVTGHTDVLATIRGVADTRLYDLEQVREEYGLEPGQIADLKALAGDSSDNIPGVPGIGPKTATALLQQFNSVENVLEHLEEIESARVRGLLAKHREQALLSKRLASLAGGEAPLKFDPEGLRWQGYEKGKLRELLLDLEFSRLLHRLESRTEADTGTDDHESVPGPPTVPLEEVVALARRSGHLYLAGEWEKGALVGLALSSGEQMTYAFLGAAHREPALFSDPGGVPEQLSMVLGDAGLGKAGSDLKNLDRRLREQGAVLRGYRFDVTLADYVLASHRKDHTPDKLAAEYLGEHLPPAVTARRSLHEVALLPRLETALRQRLRDLGQEWLLDEIEVPLATVLAEMEAVGIAVDAEALQRLDQHFGEELERLLERMTELAGESFNPDSPQQVGQVLFERLKLPGGKRTKTGWATGAAVLETLAPEYEIIRLILQNREFGKLRSTYVKGLLAEIDPRTGRVHTTFEQAVTATGRLSSRSPNLQNIPIRTELGREIRACFVAGGPEQVLLAADYSQIELRLLAHFSKVPSLVEAFQAGQDIHARTAALIFGVTPEAVEPEQRRIAKTVNYAVVYGMGSQALAQQIGVSRAEASDFINHYFERLSGVKEYLDQVVASAREQGYVQTICGRRRYLPELHSSNTGVRSYAERAAANTPLQGSAADLMKMAMVRLAKALPGVSARARLLLQVHDELVLEVPREELAAVAALVKEIMQSAWNLDIPLEVEAKAGDNWRDLAEVK